MGVTGFTLLEMILTIGVVSMVLVVMAGVSNIVSLQQSSQYQAIARQLLVEEGEALRNASFSDLENRNMTAFIEVAYNNGRWGVENSGSARSLPNVYQVTGVSGAVNPSRQVVPAGALGDGVYTVPVRLGSASPAGWKAGFFFRYHDDQNYYLLQMSGTGLQMLRVLEGAPTVLWSIAQAFNKNTWYELTVTAIGSSFTVSLDGTVKTLTPISDTTFTNGQFVLGAFDGAIVDFDDISFAGAATLAWNFDVNEAIGNPARGWRRIGPGDVPSGSTSVTIANTVVGFTDLKRVDLRVQWSERKATRSLANTFYLNQQSVAP
ncbi:MAG: hypothetical protein V1778_05160 [bacterium]